MAQTPDLTPSAFHPARWARTNLVGASELPPSTLDAVEGFTIIWNVFEPLLEQCSGASPTEKLKAFSTTHGTRLTTQLADAILISFDYVRSRYVTDGRNSSLSRLQFRRSDREEELNTTLLASAPTDSARLEFLLRIAYRVRNNLFHGLKTVREWNSSERLIQECARALSVALALAAPHLVAHRPTSS